jgi:hypothetical protein
MAKSYIRRGLQIEAKKVGRGIKKLATPTNIRKTLNTVGKVGGYVGKGALAAAIITNPELVVGYEGGALLATKLGKSLLAKQAFGLATKYGDKYFKDKTGTAAKVYKSSRDIGNAVAAFDSGDTFGAMSHGANFVSDSGILGKKKTQKFNNVNNHYLQPGLKAASGVHTIARVAGNLK